MKKTMTRRAVVLIPLGLAACAALAMRAGEPPAAPAARADSEVAPIASLGFLAGAWRSDDGSTEEIWSAPEGNNIIGAFRWLRPDGTPAMMEMLAITRERDAVRLRLRHYDALLRAKEDADKPVTFTLAKLEQSRAEFIAEKDAGYVAGVNYEVADGVLRVQVFFTPPQKADEPAREPLVFVLKKR